ncbi:MAG: PAS domain S-box protein [Smithellaceae bacterium]
MKHVLIVDDNDDNLYLLRALLTGHGYKVDQAANGSEALAKALASKYDMIISDILMPVMDGFTLCKIFKADERLEQIPFIFYTATYTDPRDEKLALNMGVDAFIVKPAEPEDFLRRIEEIIAANRKGKLISPQKETAGETVVLKEYNEALIRKLEDKMLDLEAEIAARKKVEDSLRESEERYRSLFENSLDGVLLTEPDGNVLKANRTACRIFGRSEEEICRVGRAGLVDFSDVRLSEAIEERARTGIFSGELICLRKDGTRFPCEIASSIFKDSAGKTKSCMIIRDITERKIAEEALSKSEERLRRFYESGMLGVIFWDRDGQITDANNKFLEMIGYSREDMKAGLINGYRITPPEFEIVDEHAVSELIVTGVNKSPYEKEYVRKDGIKIPILIAGALLDSEQFNGIAFVLDITERKQAASQREAALAEISKLNENLERRVAERTAELNGTIAQLEELNRVFVGRELKMVELKERIAELERCNAGQA